MLLPVWRYLIINTTERILTGPIKRSIPTKTTSKPPQGGPKNVRTETIFHSLLEICMAVTEPNYPKRLDCKSGNLIRQWASGQVDWAILRMSMDERGASQILAAIDWISTSGTV